MRFLLSYFGAVYLVYLFSEVFLPGLHAADGFRNTDAARQYTTHLNFDDDIVSLLQQRIYRGKNLGILMI